MGVGEEFADSFGLFGCIDGESGAFSVSHANPDSMLHETKLLEGFGDFEGGLGPG